MKIYTNNEHSILRRYCELFWLAKIIFLILVFGLKANASSYGQKISLTGNVKIINIFKAIKNQTSMDVLWQPSQLNVDRVISANFVNTSIESVLIKCLLGQNMDFKIEDNTVVILSKRLFFNRNTQIDSVIYKGRILDEKNIALPGATVKVKGSNKSTKSNSEGYFFILGPKKGALQISYIGYLNKEVTLNSKSPDELIIIPLIPGTNNLGEVNVVSTGYQELPKERATGSFEVITKEQLQHSTDPNLVKRLEGITTSMNFNNQVQPTNSADKNNRTSPIANLTIRGKNTLEIVNNAANSSGQVLVVIDGIASPYSIDKVNPNDVETITILKDAASASIWGSRASNGVIVITTKRGGYNKPLGISINSNVVITDKLDLFYKEYMSTSDFIDAQIFRFNAAGTNVRLPNVAIAQAVISPVAEILGQQKRGEISAGEANAQIDLLRGNDVRRDYDKYLLRKSITQSYSIDLNGGSKNLTYRLSAAYDNAQNNTVYSDQNRLTLNYNTSFRPLKNLEIFANVIYNKTQVNDQQTQNSLSGSINRTFYPYTRLADDAGNPLVVPKTYRPAFINLLANTYGNKILDLNYVPLNDIKEGYSRISSQAINFNVGAKYSISNVFSANVLFNHNRGYDENISEYNQNSFYMRDLITFYTSPGSFTRNIPLGGQYIPSITRSHNESLRGQINANKTWNSKHVLSAIAGIDLSQNYFLSKQDQYYGYSPQTLRTNNNLNFAGFVTTLFADPTFGSTDFKIPFTSNIADQRTRSYSLFTNAAYTYDRRYTLSGSIRKDVSSEFGLGTNKGGTPYYSVGGSWNIANESFYDISWLPVLQLRSTFGYNGNVNARITARPILTYSTGANNTTGLFYASVNDGLGISNRELRPEKTAIVNLGLDFGFLNNRISGSIEYYDKKTTDLLSSAPVDPTTGYSTLVFNTATLHGWGTDIALNSQNIKAGLFSWSSNFLFSYNKVIVEKLFSKSAQTALQVISGAPGYNEGASLSRLFAYKWGGLDPNTGDPRGVLNGEPRTISASTDGIASQIAIQNAPSSTAVYFGSSVPVYYGSLRNTFRYGGFAISANLLYKFGYYFRRPSSDVVAYDLLYKSNTLQGIEFNNRWKKPGDEQFTNVPSLIYPTSTDRDSFYQYSEINVLKADHIRLQEINLSYGFNKTKSFLKNPRIYANISNLGVVWRANKLGLDPDIFDYPIPRTYSIGFNANF